MHGSVSWGGDGNVQGSAVRRIIVYVAILHTVSLASCKEYDAHAKGIVSRCWTSRTDMYYVQATLEATSRCTSCCGAYMVTGWQHANHLTDCCGCSRFIDIGWSKPLVSALPQSLFGKAFCT